MVNRVYGYENVEKSRDICNIRQSWRKAGIALFVR